MQPEARSTFLPSSPQLAAAVVVALLALLPPLQALAQAAPPPPPPIAGVEPPAAPPPAVAPPAAAKPVAPPATVAPPAAAKPATPPAVAPPVTAPPVVAAPATAPTTAPAAAPAGRQKVLILRAESTAVPDATRIAVTKEIFAQAGRYKQLDSALSGADLVEEMFEFECTEAGVECLGKIGAKYGAQFVVFSEISKNAVGALQISMRVIDVLQARVAQTTVQAFEHADKPGAALARGLIVLLGPVDLPAAEGERPGTLHVALAGGGVALVYVDDHLAGRTTGTGMSATFSPGMHQVRIVRAGFRDWTGRVAIGAGATAELSVQLEQVADVTPPGEGIGAAKPPETSITHKWWFWTAIAVGIGLVTGVTIAATRGTTAPAKGTAAFSMDQNDAHLDPIFLGAGAGK